MNGEERSGVKGREGKGRERKQKDGYSESRLDEMIWT
jgi:hypothetical protein